MLERFCQGIDVMRNHDQMNVIGHQAVADQRCMMFFRVFPQQVQIYSAIDIAVQDKLPRVSTLRHMMSNLKGYYAGESCHA